MPPATPPTVSELVQGEFDNLTSLVTGTLAPGVFALAVIGIAIAVGVKYVRKAGSKA